MSPSLEHFISFLFRALVLHTSIVEVGLHRIKLEMLYWRTMWSSSKRSALNHSEVETI